MVVVVLQAMIAMVEKVTLMVVLTM